jgi:hypothetical protein
VILFFPLGIATFWVALSSGRADAGTAIAGLVIGSLTMAFPVVLLRIRSKPYFRQDPAHP